VVLKNRGGVGLSQKSCPEAFVLRVPVGEYLQGDGSVFDGVIRLVDLAHSAPAEQPIEVVFAEPPAGVRARCVQLDLLWYRRSIQRATNLWRVFAEDAMLRDSSSRLIAVEAFALLQ
jgi:hypothetical protein